MMRIEKTIYMVRGNTGEYSDHCEWIVCAYGTEKESIDLATELNTLARIATNKLPGDDGYYNHKWRETDAGKNLLLKDPGAMVDYTGLDYTVIPITLRQASAVQYRQIMKMALEALDNLMNARIIYSGGGEEDRVCDVPQREPSIILAGATILALKQALNEMGE